MIKEQPDASQQDFSDQLDISPSAISNCMRDVPGFTWKNRKKFVRKFYGDGVYDGEENNSDVNGAPDDGEEAELDEISEQIQTLQEKCASLSERVDELEQMNGEAGVTDPDVIRKVVLTLDNSDRFTEEEKNLLLDKWHGK